MAVSIAASTLLAANARLCIAPLPKVASTLLKRVAVLADGREPATATAFGETRPALVIHRAEVHGLPCLADLNQEQQEHWLGDAHALRLAVTRHPAERLLSFWHDKLHLADPAYAPLNASVQAARQRSVDEPCRFADFLSYLSDHWELLKTDGHLRPQSEWLGEAPRFERLDRDELVKRLPRLLQPLVPAATLGRIKDELATYDKQYRQRLGKRWEDAYSKDGLQLVESLYGDDLKLYAYTMPRRRSDKVRPLAGVDTDALVDSVQQLRERYLLLT